MILVVCLNPAVDVTYRVKRLYVGTSHRVDSVTRRAGGKGINVARVLRALGGTPTLIGLAGESGSTVFVPELARERIACDFAHVGGESRQTVTVVDGGGADDASGAGDRATVLNEPGPAITQREWSGFCALYTRRLTDAKAVVLSGSLPPGLPSSTYAELTASARSRGAKVILDADGEALRSALGAGPDVVKPNADEAAVVLGRRIETAQDAREAADALRERGAGAAVVSRGARGLVASVGDRDYQVGLDEPIAGNPTGAGDALVAVLAAGLARGVGLPNLLCDAVAISAAAVAVPHAGGFDPEVARELRPRLTAEEF